MGTEEISATDEDMQVPSDLEQKIIRQVEYYFGNFNLSRDKFLKQEIKNDDGWVPLETMVKFHRLKQLTEDFQTICDALKKSPNQLMEVNEECTKIRRIAPVPENMDRDEIDSRTLYVKGFKRDTKLDEILEFFKDHKVENVTMRKRKQGNKFFFKGSVFAAFQTKEDCDAFLEKKGLKFDKTEMIVERKKDYVKRKDEFYDNLRAEKAKKAAEKQANGEKEVVVEGNRTKNCLLKVIGLSTNSTREDLREALDKFGTIAFVDYSKSKPEAIVRFEEGIVPDVLTQLEEEDGVKKLQVGSVKTTVSLIEGEDEMKYFQEIEKSKARTRERFRGNKQGNKGRFGRKQRGKGYQGKNKRNANEDNANEEEPNAKKIKVESNEEESDKPSANIKQELNEAHEDEPQAKKKKVEQSEVKPAEIKVETE